MNRTASDAETFINDLDLEEVGTLVDVLVKVDKLEMKDGKPLFTGAEIDLIGRFEDFNNGIDVDAGDESDEDENNEDTDDDETDDETDEEPTSEIPPGQVSAVAPASINAHDDTRANA